MRLTRVLVCVCVAVVLASALLPAGAHARVQEEDEEDEFADEVEEAPVVVEEVPVAKTNAKQHEAVADDEFADEDGSSSESTSTPPSDVPLTPAQTRRPLPLDFSHYTLEVFLLMGIIAYALNYISGSGKNTSIAKLWLENNLETLSEQFAQVGPPPPKTDKSDKSDKSESTASDAKNAAKPSDILITESPNEFCLFGTGRRYCATMTCDLLLMKRHCLYGLVNEAIAPQGDLVSINVEMTQMDPFVIVICLRKLERRIRAEYEDVRNLTSVHNGDRHGLPESLVILTDCPDALGSVLKPEVVNTIKALDAKNEFHYLYISDQKFYYKVRENVQDLGLKEMPVPHKMMKLVCKAATNEAGVKEQTSILKMCCTLIDAAARTQLSVPARARADKKRQNFLEILAKHIGKLKEAEAQERREKKKQEERAALEKKGGDALAKFEDKEAKREMKKKMKSGKVMVARM